MRFLATLGMTAQFCYMRGGKCGDGISTSSTTSRRIVIPSAARNPFPIG
ncbi:MAG: hypothetical protein LBI45_07900 [Bacteroidales bacterium]|nr:hypothetical protein [Bacteroidales bacterium]